jgi:diguanylate cyclase (GGDEF)-like protein
MIENDILFRGMLVAILGLFAAVFAATYFHDRKQQFAAWLAIAYTCGLAAFLVDISRAAFDPIVSDVTAKLLFWGFSLAFSAGIFSRHETKFPTVIVGMIVGVGLVILSWFSLIEPDTAKRTISSSSIAGLILVVALPVLWQKRKGVLGNIFLLLFTLLCATYFVRPLLVYGILDIANTTDSYRDSTYDALLYGSSAIGTLTCGMNMLIIIGYDIIRTHQLASTRDPLTGLMNRRGLEKYVKSHIDEKASAGRAVIMADLDKFKQINDTFGHEVGDEVLKRVGALLEMITSELGAVARVGGEEFVIILNEMNQSDAIVVAQHLRLSLGAILHPELEPGQKITSRLGIAIMEERESFGMAMRRADFALYEAKAAGRNCVIESSTVTDVPGEEMTAVQELASNCIPFPNRKTG